MNLLSENKKNKLVALFLVSFLKSLTLHAIVPFEQLQEAPFKNVDEEIKNLPISITPYFTVIDTHSLCSPNRILLNTRIEIKNKAYLLKKKGDYEFQLHLYECDHALIDTPISRVLSSSVNKLLNKTLYFFYQDDEDQYHFASIVLEKDKLDQYFTDRNEKTYLLSALTLKPKKSLSKSLIYIKNDKGEYQIVGFTMIGIDSNINNSIPMMGITLLPNNSEYDKPILVSALTPKSNATKVFDFSEIPILTQIEANKEEILPLGSLNENNKPTLFMDSTTIYTCEELNDNLKFVKNPILTQSPVQRACFNSYLDFNEKPLFIVANFDNQSSLITFTPHNLRTDKKTRGLIIKLSEAQIKAITQNPFVFIKSDEGQYHLIGCVNEIQIKPMLSGNTIFSSIVIDYINVEVNSRINHSILEQVLNG